MDFTDDVRILIENLYIFKGYGGKNLLIKEFPDKGWALSSIKRLLNYWNILAVCFASFLLALRDVKEYTSVLQIEWGTFPPNIIKIGHIWLSYC